VPAVIFKEIRQGRPYPEHGFSMKDWAQIPPQQVPLTNLITTATVVELEKVLSEDPTLPGDLFPHAVRWCGELFLEDGLHRALRAALQQRTTLPVRILDLDLLRS
jgi:Arc/MetJ family transcription regulator